MRHEAIAVGAKSRGTDKATARSRKPSDLAEAVRRACVDTAISAYEDAGIQGLCGEGRWEYAIGVLRHFDLQAVTSAKKIKSSATLATGIRVKRVYDPPARTDGTRILVDRLWPRGLSRDKAKLDDWVQDIAPSPALRRWFGHDPARWEEFQRRFAGELDSHPDIVLAFVERLRGNRVTLLFAAHDTAHNNAVALMAYFATRFGL